MPSTLWTLYNEATTILNTWDFESPKTELKWVRYDQNKNSKNKDSKKVQQSGFSRNYLKREPQTTIRSHQRVALEKSHNFAFWIAQIGWEMKELWGFEILENMLLFFCIYCRKSAISQKLKTPTGCSELVRNPVHANEICNHTKFDIPDSTAQSKFPSEVISIKSGSHFQRPF